jgi:hypothetical protein
VRRAALVVFLTLLTFQVSGLSAMCGDVDCEESCPTDLSGGQCSPSCHYCSCCSLPRVAGCSPLVMPEPSRRGRSWVDSVEALTAPEPADILHVPKLSLA